MSILTPYLNIMVFLLVEVAVQGMVHLRKVAEGEYHLPPPPHALSPGLLGQEQGCHQHPAPEPDQLLLQPDLSQTLI